jgi:surface antigen
MQAYDLFLNNFGSGIAEGHLKPGTLEIESMVFRYTRVAPGSPVKVNDRREIKAGKFEWIGEVNDLDPETLAKAIRDHSVNLKITGTWVNPVTGNTIGEFENFSSERVHVDLESGPGIFNEISAAAFKTLLSNARNSDFETEIKKGIVVGSLDGVPGYFNGLQVGADYGSNFASNETYLGLKWQCVEYIRRYYFKVFGIYLKFTGNAKMWKIAGVADGARAPASKHGLLQYNYLDGFSVKPQRGDIIVWTAGDFGHVAIVGTATDDVISLAQQNVNKVIFRSDVELQKSGDRWKIKGSEPAALLRAAEIGLDDA